MEDKTILKLAAICSMLGLLLLIYASERVEIKPVSISSLNPGMVDKNIKIEGTVTLSSLSKDVYFLTIKDDTASIKVVAFNPNIKINKGQKVEVEGKLAVYKGELEIIAKTIRTI